MAGRAPQKKTANKRVVKKAVNTIVRRKGASFPILLILGIFAIVFIYGIYLEKNPEKSEFIDYVSYLIENDLDYNGESLGDISETVLDDVDDYSVTENDIIVDKNEEDEVLNFIETKADLQIHYIDVGQGDCSFIVNDNVTMLIDASEYDYADEIIDYIDELGYDRIDYVIATHPHADHIGGMAEIINEFEIGKVIAPKISSAMTPTTKTYEKFLLSLQKKGIKLTAAKVGDTYSLASNSDSYDNTSFQILAPVDDDYDNLNDWSIVLNLTHGDRKFLFTGDCEVTSEKDMIDDNANLSADVLKVAHHGSSSSTCEDFLSEVSPKYAVIQCGVDNRFGHPHTETVDILDKYDIETYRNDIDGNIVLYSDGEKIYFETEK